MTLCVDCSQLAQTVVNNAFFRILAPPGMSEYFILPSVSTQLLLREGVDVPDHLLHVFDVSPQLHLLWVFLGLFISVRRWWKVASG